MASTGTSQGDNRGAGSDSNLYEVIRDQLIAEIQSGSKYPAGALLPSAKQITVDWTVSTTTARRVLTELVSAGYAESRGTRGYFSLGPKDAQPTNEAPTSDGGTLTVRPSQTIAANAASALEPTTVDVRAETPPAEVALALRLAEPTARIAVRRRLTKDDQGTPVQLRTSYLPNEVATGTPLIAHAPITQAWPDALAAHTGRQLGRVDSHITARHPTDAEAAALALTPTACVLVRIDVTHDADATPIDYTVTLWPGDSTRLTVPDSA